MSQSRVVRGILAAGAVALSFTWAGASASTIVYSNNPTPGDWESHSGSGYAPSVQIGSTDWSYDGIGDGGAMGIRTDYARSGNGSVFLQTTKNASSAQATYWTGNALGSLANLDTLAYEWYRDSSSTVADILVPSLGVYVDNGAGSAGWIIYEVVYNETSGWTAPEDQWVGEDAVDGGNGQFWSWILGSWQQKSLNDWKTALSGYNVYGFAPFVGSGWGNFTFTGAVDNVSFGFSGSSETYNFETTAVPEPSSIALMAIAGGLGLAGVARRRLARG